ncbi:type IV toxin-antitoxin system AbiEi family antitoxin domain-containing protein [Micromonospora saelicesensis]|uniref:type IV toxin-antitoxin system AbiEi family antitoxin domain-containing protein n=1 Tax=Micromonospora saelicesensis TaxID=285676 RepID=UPI0021ACBCE5|nr:type IV toxin-antitoxin system AbiEi family antitoxin domain-containing protein [Micromonospora saelicesensis]
MVTLGQALRAGLTRDQIRQLHRSGRWQRLLRGCFLPEAELSDSTRRRARIRAAVVSLGPGAFAVRDSAFGVARHRGSSPDSAGPRLGASRSTPTPALAGAVVDGASGDRRPRRHRHRCGHPGDLSASHRLGCHPSG